MLNFNIFIILTRNKLMLIEATPITMIIQNNVAKFDINISKNLHKTEMQIILL